VSFRCIKSAEFIRQTDTRPPEVAAKVQADRVQGSLEVLTFDFNVGAGFFNFNLNPDTPYFPIFVDN
jgi:hypothetical protein